MATRIIKTLTIKRKVEREVMVKKVFNENTQVELLDLERDEIYQLDKETAQAVAVAFFDLYSEAKETICGYLELTEPPMSQEKIVTETVNKDTHQATGSNHTAEVGAKNGKTSKYHYVFFDNTTKTYRTIHNSIKHETEIEAALASDAWLEQTGDNLRPKNRMEFPEVMEAYDEAA